LHQETYHFDTFDGWDPIRSIWCFCWLYHLCSHVFPVFLCGGHYPHVGFLGSKIWSPKCGLNPIGQTSLIHSCPLAGWYKTLCSTMNIGKRWPIIPCMAKSKGSYSQDPIFGKQFSAAVRKPLYLMVKTLFT
jgi:hypothetical protein